jgi:hypothetical protein
MNILDALDEALESGADIRPVVGAFMGLARDVDADTKAQMLAAIEERIAGHPAERVGFLAILAGAIIEMGGDPKDFPRSVFDHLAQYLETIEGPEDERELPEAYYLLEKGAMACLSRSAELRASLPQKPLLLSRIKRYQERYGFLGKMLQVLDGEPLVVLHPESGRGFRFTMSGVADNFQLHLLLHGALAGTGPDRIEGVVPSPDALSQGSDGEWGDSNAQSKWQLAHWFALRAGGAIDREDYQRTWIWNEGTPFDIAAFEGTRVVLIGPSTIERSWNANRVFPGMVGRLEGPTPLAPDEARGLLSRIGAAIQ